MVPAPLPRDWASQLIANEMDAATASMGKETETFLVYEKLRQNLAIAVGLDGFRALASRALKLARAQATTLSAVQLTADGCLLGFNPAEPNAYPGPDREAGVIFIAHLLQLLLTFLGEATTLQLVHDVFPKVSNPAETTRSPSFDGLRQEVGNLRQVSETLESLANEHPAAEDGLMIISANIRNIATILDVFAVVKNASETALTSESLPPTTHYMM